MQKFVLAFIASLVSMTAIGSDLESLALDGYGVVDETSIVGYDFNGCDHDKIIHFNNGLVFQCGEYSYHYSYNPDVYILKHVMYDDYKVIIDDEEFEGRLGRYK